MIRTVKDTTLINENNRWDDLAYLTNISSCIWLKKVKQIIITMKENKEERRNCINKLIQRVRNISSYRIFDIERYRKIYNDYTSHFLNESIGAVEQFITDCNNNSIDRYFNVKYIGSKRQRAQIGNNKPKNIIMDFNSRFFAEHTGRIEDIPLYPTCYFHYFMIAYLLEIMNINPKSYSTKHKFFVKFFNVLNKSLSSSVLTGFKAFAEYELSFPYCCLYDELRKLTSLYQNKLVFFATPQNKSFEIAIKEYSLITRMFANFRNIPTTEDVGKIIFNSTINKRQQLKSRDVIHINSDKFLDNVKDVFSKIRITEGNNKYRMHVEITVSGQRIVNRLLDRLSNVRNNVKTHKVIDYIPNTANMIAFLLYGVLNCTEEARDNFKELNRSLITVWGKFISNLSPANNRNIIVKTAIPIILIAKTQEEQEEIINKYFAETDTKQKAFIRECIGELKKIKGNVPIGEPSFTARLAKELKHVYNW